MTTSTSFTDEELGLTPQDLEGLDPHIREEIRTNRALRKQLTTLTEGQAKQERELAFYRAGIPADKKGAFFAAGYTGDLTPEAIKAEYDEVFGAPAKTDEELAKEGDLDAAKRIADAGGEVPGTSGLISFEDAIKNAADGDALREVLRNAPPEAGIRLT